MKHFIAFMCFSCLLTTKVLSKELSDITYEIMVDDKALTLNVVSEQYHECEYYCGRFDCNGKVKLVVTTSFDLSKVKVVANQDIDLTVKGNRLIL